MREVVPNPPRLKKTYSPDEVREQVAFVESLLCHPESTERQRQLACTKRFGFGLGRMRMLVARVREQWEKEDAHLRQQRKAEQSRRLYRYIGNAASTTDQKGNTVRPNWAAVARFEELLADLHGTREPIKIDVDTRASEAVMLVIAQMTPEQVQARLERYKQCVEATEGAERGLLPEASPPDPTKH